MTNDINRLDGNNEEIETDDQSKSVSQKGDVGGSQSRCLRDRSRIQPPRKYEANFVEFHEPVTYEEAVNGCERMGSSYS